MSEDVVKLAVPLKHDTHAVLEGICHLTGDNFADSIARAIKLYGLVLSVGATRRRFVIGEVGDGSAIVVHARRVRPRRWFW